MGQLVKEGKIRYLGLSEASPQTLRRAMKDDDPEVRRAAGLVLAELGLRDAEAAEARRMSCEDVRLELGAAAEGLHKLTTAARRHVRVAPDQRVEFALLCQRNKIGCVRRPRVFGGGFRLLAIARDLGNRGVVRCSMRNVIEHLQPRDIQDAEHGPGRFAARQNECVERRDAVLGQHLPVDRVVIDHQDRAAAAHGAPPAGPA